MNKILLQKVKDKCKDMGLSEAFVIGITERIGGAIADDSTDEEAIETVANQVMEIAKLSQGEATRWVDKNKAKQTPKPQEQPPKEPEPPQTTINVEEIVKTALEKVTASMNQRIQQLETQNAQLLEARTKEERNASVNAAYAKHRIPEQLRSYMVVPDTVKAEEIDQYVANIAQQLVTLQLPSMKDGVQVPTQAITKEEASNIAAKMLPGFGKKE